MRRFIFLILAISALCAFSSQLVAQANVTIGDGAAVNGTTDYPAPYGTWYRSFRQQFLYRITEIEDAGGGPGAINSIAFNVAALNNCSAMSNYRIRLKHSTQAELNTNYETGTYQEVFVSNSFMPTTGWNTHTFSTPFVWNGTQNILVDIVTDVIDGNYAENAAVYYSTTTYNSSLRYNSDSSSGADATTGSVYMSRSNTRFNMQTIVVTEPPNPAVLISPANNALGVMTSATLNWSSGGGVPSNYKVHFGTQNPPPFVLNTQETSYAPTMAINTQYYWQIIPENAIGPAPNCPIWTFQTSGPVVHMSNGTQAIPDGMSYAFFDSGGPDANYSNSENFTFTFTAANPSSTIFVSFVSFATENNWDYLKIYNGADTSAPQIGPPAGYTGSDMPADIIGTNAITFAFTSDGSGAYAGWQASVTAVNLQHDLGIVSLTGNQTPSAGAPTDYTVRVRNNGNNPESIYTVKLMGEGDIELATVAGTTIAPSQEINLILTWTPTTIGPTTIWAQVILADDAIAANNLSSPMNIGVFEPGSNVITIGGGTYTNNTSSGPSPYGTFWKNFRQQYLYTAADFYGSGGMPGTITAIAFNVAALNTCSPMPNYRIRLKLTDAEALTTTFETGEYTTVYTSTSYMPIADLNVHTFDTPFFWDGASSLIVEVVTDLTPGTWTQDASVYHTETPVPKSLRYISDSSPAIDGTTGSITNYQANASFFISPVGGDPLLIVTPSEHDFGTVLFSSTAHRNFLIVNAGGGTLGINSISLTGSDDFTLTNLPVLPADLNTGNTLNFGLDFSPTTEGLQTAQISITDNATREVHIVEITGTGYDATIYTLPFMENWDTVVAPDLPLGWTRIRNSNETYAVLETYNYSPYSMPNCVQFSNSSDANAELILISPVVDNVLDVTDIRVKFMLKGGSNYQIQVGTIVNPADHTTFELCETLTSQTAWTEATVNLTAHTGVGRYIAFRQGITSSYQTVYLDDVTFEEIAPNDLAALTISGNSTPSVNASAQYTIGVFNNGTADQTDYLVKLFDGNDVELASTAGPAILAGASATVMLSWTPTVQGPTSIYGKVVLVGDINPINDISPSMALAVQPEGILSVTIGEGNELQGVPWEFFYKSSLFQTLYYQDEMAMFGTITALSLYNNFSTNLANTPVKIWLGTTTLEDLSGGWIDPTSLTLVYDGTINLPSGANTITIPLQTPFTYPGGNLVFYAKRPLDGQYYSSTDDFLAQTVGNNRSCNIYGDSTDYDPMAPPAGGTVSGTFPKATFILTPITGDPVFSVSPSVYNFGDVNLSGSKSKTFNIMNIGGSALGITSVSIAGSGTMTLSQIPTLPLSLATGEIASFTVSFTPAMLGTENAIVTITDDLDNRHVIFGKASPNSRNGNRDTHTVAVSGTGVNDITIGSGNQTAHFPMDFYWKNSIFETVYTINEMSNFVGMITGIKFYNDFDEDLADMPTKIWLGSSTQPDLADGWIPSTDLTLVFDGVVNYPSGQNIISINFPEMYMHLDSGNLVMMVQRPMDTTWHSYNDNFKCQSEGSSTRSRFDYSDSSEFDPATISDGQTTSQFPKTTFVVIPGGVGHITGTVTTAAGQPLAGVEVEVVNRRYSTTTDANGEFHLANILPNDFAVTFSRYTYISQTVNITLDEDETEIMNITMQLMPQVSVTGTILASDTGLGIAGANIHLNGYADYSQSSSADGSFAETEVFANQSYEYIISAAGYTSTSGIIDVGSTNYAMGNITLTEIAYAPNTVEAAINDSYDAINLSWNAPDPNAVEITESFESTTFPPQDWAQIITNDGPVNTLGVKPTWCNFDTITISGSGSVSPTEGIKQAGLWWDYTHQDEWLLTPSFNCPPDAHLSFDTYLEMGSPNEDHYYVKVTTTGGASWIPIWDGSDQPEGLHNYAFPITVGLQQFSGMQIQLAFHAIDPPTDEGLWFQWFIDNVYIGNFIDRICFEPASLSRYSPESSLNTIGSKIGRQTPDQPNRANIFASQKPALRKDASLTRALLPDNKRSTNRALLGYQVWRLISGQELNENSWTALTADIIGNINYSDEGWNNLANATYKWAIKAIYTAGVSSVPAFSNPVVKEVLSGNIVGFVRKTNGQGIAGATISDEEGHTATTNTAGAYILTLPAGVYTITASAGGYEAFVMNNITVVPNQNTTLNFTLDPTANENEVLPVTVTALKANFPNPFNPTTTISYDLKDAGKVSLDVYNLKGQRVRTLVSQDQPSGRYRIVFDACDQQGNPLASGIYLYRLQTESYHSTRKMLLME
ncbi:MAG: carboxypeptidase regulatory-like domain-containing protein [Candidatus Cloacimonetes bacterium]|nr:carboxypeptidase regulatory-like domain-containing protein [Candidatus Cloacimonadota bacterium]MCB5287221.1 carboxypeptidase regulatory-like domain-containing protein [Candidatus Cloacimonadota bacterium]MCK9184545.1 carboxypeptidase regulatory-like domain-containing protein [Candidatus Cloacimonadota bacterium]MDY0229542.1 carboxypeptidase regulatory-like domain-containing protein [Candidatus Cloacimonadaceae bacterium]